MLGAAVQRCRTVNDVLETAGQGILRLGMRLYAFEVSNDELVLRYVATARSRLMAIEESIGRPLRGLRAPLAELPAAHDVVRERRVVDCEDLDLLASFLELSVGAALEPAAGSGVLAPLFVRDAPWGLLGLLGSTLTRDDAEALSLFAVQVGSALEAVESSEALERVTLELASTREELARTHEELLERERLATLGELAAAVAHEVRNPLCVLFQSLGGVREFLRTGAPAARLEEAEAFASIADEEANHLSRVVADLLEFARPHPPALLVLSLVPVLASVAAATAADGRVRLEIEDDLPLVQLDPLFMQQALLNLVLNGLQAIAKDGTVTVRASSAPAGADRSPCVRIDVIDDGHGIPANVRASIFEPFVTTRPTGTGIGLAVVRRIVDAHGGGLTVEGSPNGTTFTMTLPAVFRG